MKGKKARDGLNSFNDAVRFVAGEGRRGRRMKVDEARNKNASERREKRRRRKILRRW